MARAIPVLPEVASIRVSPAWICPRNSARVIIDSAGRSLTEPAGLFPSSLSNRVLLVAPGRRCKRTRGVLPTQSAMVGYCKVMAYSQSRLRGLTSYRQTSALHITQSMVLMAYRYKPRTPCHRRLPEYSASQWIRAVSRELATDHIPENFARFTPPQMATLRRWSGRRMRAPIIEDGRICRTLYLTETVACLKTWASKAVYSCSPCCRPR